CSRHFGAALRQSVMRRAACHSNRQSSEKGHGERRCYSWKRSVRVCRDFVSGFFMKSSSWRHGQFQGFFPLVLFFPQPSKQKRKQKMRHSVTVQGVRGRARAEIHGEPNARDLLARRSQFQERIVCANLREEFPSSPLLPSAKRRREARKRMFRRR